MLSPINIFLVDVAASMMGAASCVNVIVVVISAGSVAHSLLDGLLDGVLGGLRRLFALG